MGADVNADLGQAEQQVRMLLASKHHCSPELSKAGRELLDALAARLAQDARALRSIATVPPADLADVEERDYWKRQAVYCRRIASEALAAPDSDEAK